MIVIFKKECFYKNNFYNKGDKLNINDNHEVWKLNEKGFIEPINIKNLKNKKDLKEE